MRVVEEKEWRGMNIVEVYGDGVVWGRTATATAERRHPLSLLPAPCSLSLLPQFPPSYYVENHVARNLHIKLLSVIKVYFTLV